MNYNEDEEEKRDILPLTSYNILSPSYFAMLAAS